MPTRTTWLVPRHRMWRAQRLRIERADSSYVAVQARHRVLRWQTIVVGTADLRFGAEAVARYLDGAPVGYTLVDNRGRRNRSRFSSSARPAQQRPARG